MIYKLIQIIIILSHKGCHKTVNSVSVHAVMTKYRPKLPWNYFLHMLIVLGMVFSQFWVFGAFFLGFWAKFSDLFHLRIYLSLFSKWPSRSHSFHAKIGLKNDTPCAEKLLGGRLHAMLKSISSNISALGDPFFKQIFELKLWDQDGP